MALLASAQNLERLARIAQVLARHGFGELLSRSELSSLLPSSAPSSGPSSQPSRAEGEREARAIAWPARVRLVLQDLGPSFVKLGQILSTRPDLLPPALIVELARLQENVPPVPFEAIRRTVEAELSRPLDEVFASFSETALASASIGQVHRATLRAASGELVDVAVKVQRPGIGETIDRDLDLLYLLARAVERAVPESTIYSPTRLVAEFDKAIRAELDYAVEGANAERFRKNFEDAGAVSELVRFPRFFAEASSTRVHVAEFFDGLPIAEAVARGFPGDVLAKNALAVIARMIFVDGLFHADPHPGNVRVLGTPERPVIGLLDLGMVGTLSPALRDQAVDLLVAAVSQDTDDLADALLAMGRPRDKVDRDAFRAEVSRLAAVHLGKPLKEIQLAALVRDLVQGAVDFAIEMPPEVLLVGKALMTVEGIGKQLHPDLDVFDELRPFFLRLVYERYSPRKVGARMVKAANRVSGAALDLPPLLAEILDDARRGRLRVRAEDAGLARATERAGRRVALGLVAAACAMGGVLSLLHDRRDVALGLGLLALVLTMLAWGRIETPRTKATKRKQAAPRRG